MSKDFEQTSLLFAGNAVFLEQIYQIYLSDPDAVDENWRNFFQNFHESNIGQTTKTMAQAVLNDSSKDVALLAKQSGIACDNAFKIQAMIDAYRQRGHYLVKLDPLGLEQIPSKSAIQLNIENFGFANNQLESKIKVSGRVHNITDITLKDFIASLDKIYASTIGLEFKHVENSEEYKWLCDTIEHNQQNFSLLEVEQRNILKGLLEVEGFEQYLHTKFPGAKRFSIEGGESYVVALNQLIDIAADNGFVETIIGMAHRGRLSSLSSVMQKPYRAIFSEFAGCSAFPSDFNISGDVKYHMGYSSERVNINGHAMRLSLAANPSHLEAVNTVVAGKVRAKQDLINDVQRKKILAVLVHGDAAFCGQGIVAEGLAMSSLSSYSVGGVVHFVINNQVGFTANSADTHVGRYATDIAKSTAIPILHVNGDDIEAVLRATYIALHYKHVFSKDIVIDIICYRKYGHNEGDEPMYTQSVMYNVIKTKKSPANLYAEYLLKHGLVDDDYIDHIKTTVKARLDAEYEQAKTYQPENMWFQGLWQAYGRNLKSSAITGVEANSLRDLGLKLCQTPTDFALNPKLKKLFELREATLKSGEHIDWATAEQLAFASLLVEGTPIRLTGQDSGRGTFSHRHSVLHSQVNENKYIPLNHLSDSQAQYFVADSNLSEYGVLGFEYGYSTVDPNHLVLWEAQFGDFANGAQIIFDQFIAASENKWLEMSGLVVLLPHGLEGQGPEHSSSRLERFLSLAAEDNMQICYPTIPASFFHLLRRQIHRKVRKPLIVMTPKSLLRHKSAVSSLSDLGINSCFVPVIDEIDRTIEANKVKRVVICSGKVYYDLLELRNTKNIKNVVIIRIEQLYPFDADQLTKILVKYNKTSEFIWCQEEPKNMGAWNFINSYLDDILHQMKVNNKFEYVGRNASASPAVGYLSVHNMQQGKLVDEALGVK